ncbi:MAG: hypothetical protein H0X24_02215 [Ktedonobacterales bacterium]|nr:hypothetical protein [Ktedonobacterales bacterium]
MAVTRAELEQLLSAISNLENSLQHLRTAANNTENASTTLAQQAWQSSEAAPTFQRNLATWQTDHNELVRLTTQLIPLLQEAERELRTAEQKLSS